jgi:Predicted membrane protein
LPRGVLPRGFCFRQGCSVKNNLQEDKDMKQHEKLLTVLEGALCIALAYALSFFKFKIWPDGGSIDIVMVPLLIYAWRRGAGWGVIAGLIFGTIKCFFAGGFAWGWQSILLDYVVAYGAVGLGGLLRNGKHGLPLGALLGSVCRFIVHFISGVTIYKILEPTEFAGKTFSNPALYSAVYNGSYMLVNLILAVVLCALLEKPMEKLLKK